MGSIRISADEILDAKRILSFTVSAKESAKGSVERELALTITKTDGNNVLLLGEPAENAFAILRLHGY
jgi:hypothetical protein